MALEITKLQNNPDAQIIIHVVRGSEIMPTGRVREYTDPIVGFISTDVSLSSGADWQSPMDTLGGTLKTIQNLMNVGQSIVNAIVDKIGLGGFTQTALLAYAMTAVDYMGTNKPTFSLPLIFPAVREVDDPRQKILRLLECVYPSEEGIGDVIMRAPIGYARGRAQGALGFDLSEPTKGYVNVQIGQWAKLEKLVINSVDSTFSKEIVRSSGVPLYAKANVSFTFIRVPKFREVQSWFNFGRVKRET